MCETRCGMATGRNEYYLRIWCEVSIDNIFSTVNQSRKVHVANRNGIPMIKLASIGNGMEIEIFL